MTDRYSQANITINISMAQILQIDEEKCYNLKKNTKYLLISIA